MKKKKSIAVVILVLSALVLCYFAVAFHFSTHFLPNSSVQNIDISLKTTDEVKVILSSGARSYSLKVTGREDQTAEISGSDVGLKYQFSTELDSFLSHQHAYLWPVSFFEPAVYELTDPAIPDEALLDEVLKGLSFMNRKNQRQPVDASISAFDPKSCSYTLIPEDNGTTLDANLTRDAIYHAFCNMDAEIDLDEKDCYVNASVSSEDPYLNANLKAMNTFVSAEITTDYLGEKVALTGEEISQWVQQGPYTAMLDRQAIDDYVKAMSKKYDTYGKSYDFVTTSGSTKHLNSYSFGYRTDRKKEAAELLTLIKAGEKTTRVPIYSMEAYNKGQRGVGDSYVEINLGAQHLYLYQHGELILETDFVSGNVARGNTTPAGIYGITYKEKDATLRGETYTSFVHYWMPFNRNIGMHDATWRSEFGGDIYLTNGSHGCVNLPLSAAKEIFGYMEKGYPVVCYY